MYYDRGYTDLAVVYAPTIRWGFEDAKEIIKHHDGLLGYNVLVVSPSFLSTLRGRTVAKVILVGSTKYDTEAYQVLNTVLLRADFPHVEKWNLNPGLGPVGRIG